jgi:hypothetical protein
MTEINAKNFMEFFEKECGVKFIDINTGKCALDIIADSESRKSCGTCKWSANGDGVAIHEKDRVCVNADSRYVTDFVSGDMKCDLWQARRV